MPPGQTTGLPPISKNQLQQEDYRHFAMLPIFARGIASLAGADPTSAYNSMLNMGMGEVFRWWCANGVWLAGEPDFRDIAAQVSASVAEQLGFESAEIQQSMNVLAQKYSNYPCKPPPKPPSSKRSAARPVRRVRRMY